ncbi:MAG: phosphate/phosphite/phosphonate ABC transporter substrate-binding protein [Deltaproteobacteria bacterium]|nr:phosphate/phosphite/phosphonate ABC transporter substrate-binding protein [Deltaproteobacteria bacterium]
MKRKTVLPLTTGFICLFLTIVMMSCSSGTAKLGTEKNPIIMSFVPSGDTQEIVVGGDAIAKMITAITGLIVKANVGTDFAAVREAMGSGKSHIGWLNTFNYVLAHEKYGIDVGLVAIRFGQTTYRGQIVVGAKSGIKVLTDLKGKTVCWVDPNSTSGYIVPRITLKANGVDPDRDFRKTIEAGSHNNVIIAVYKGNCDAGATYADARGTIEKDYPDVKTKVSVLAITPDIPNDNVAFAKDLPKDLRDKITKALLEIAASDEGKAAMKTAYQIAGLEPCEDAFYDGFRVQLGKAGMKIEELVK